MLISQEKFEVSEIGFSINVPKGWLKIENNEVLENLKSFDFTKTQLEEMLASNNSSYDLVTYVKYHPSKYKGLIPTIKIRTRNVESKSIEEFLKVIEVANLETRKTLNNFEYINEPELYNISGINVVKFSSRFSLINDSIQYTAISYSYYILKSGYYISVNFIEDYKINANMKLYAKLAKSISLDN